MNIPEIRIKDAWLLRENASKHLHELWGNGKELVNDEWIEKRVKAYNKAWKPFENKILEHICKQLGLEFRQNIIDVYIAPWFQAFSDPMVIGIMSEPDEFVDILTHELIHRLLTDNTTIPYDADLLTPWTKLFGVNHSFTTLIHIPVHAVHKSVYLDLLKDPARLKRDVASNEDNNAEDYIKSWDYVNKNDYLDIIKNLKASYKNTAN